MVDALPASAEYTWTNVWSTGTDADTSAYDVTPYQVPPGIVIDGIGRSDTRAFGPPGTPALDGAIPNYDGTYSPGGLLGSFVGRGPRSVFEANWGVDVPADAPDVAGDADGVLGDGRLTRALFTGAISTAPQAIDRTANPQVTIRSLGTINRLLRTKPTTQLYENIRTDEAITVLLDAAGWDADLRSIDTGDQTLTYWWLNGDTDAMTALRAILAAEGVPSCAYEDGEGVFHFEGREYRQNAPRSQSDTWTLFDGSFGANPTGDDPLTLGDADNVLGDGPIESLKFHIVPSEWAANPDEVVSLVTATVNIRTATATQKVWEYGGPLTLTPSQTLDLKVTSSDPFKDAVTPVAETDYHVSAGFLAGVSLLSTSGQTITLRLIAGAGGATVIGVTSNGIQVRAVSLPITSANVVESSVDTSLTAARFEPKDYDIPLWPEIPANDALDRVNSFARRYKQPRDQMTVQVVNIDAAHLYMILTAKISDRVRIRHTHANINQAFFIETMSHDLSAGGGLHRLILHCERVTDDVPSLFGVARFGFDDYSE